MGELALISDGNFLFSESESEPVNYSREERKVMTDADGTRAS